MDDGLKLALSPFRLPAFYLTILLLNLKHSAIVWWVGWSFFWAQQKWQVRLVERGCKTFQCPVTPALVLNSLPACMATPAPG